MSERRKRRNARLAAYSVFMTFASAVLLVVALLSVRKDLLCGEETREVNALLESVSADFEVLKEENTELAKANEVLQKENNLLNETSTGAKFRQKMKSMLQSGSSTTQVIKYFFPDELIYTDQGSFFFQQIEENLAKNGYLASNFRQNSDGDMEYIQDDEVVSIKGIDVSKYNGNIDWEKVAADGVKFAYIRCGIRGYDSGKIVVDENFEKNVEGAKAAGIAVGTYFFSQAVNVEEAEEEAATVLSLLQDKQIDCPIALDVEKVEGASSTPRTSSLTADEYSDIALRFCEKIKEGGYTPMIYGNIKTFLMLLDMQKLEGVQKWFAGYISDDNITPYFPYEFRIWQYASKGKVDGIEGNVDMNIAFY